jgi:Domain of unknown function (DUF4118)
MVGHDVGSQLTPTSPSNAISATPATASAAATARSGESFESLPPKSPVLGIAAASQKTEPSPAVPLLPLVDPFVGFFGHCFFYFCQAIEFAAGWLRPPEAPAEIAVKSVARATLKQWQSCSLGTIFCTAFAAMLIPLFYSTSIKTFLPFPFLLVIIVVALRFGRAAGVLGTIATTLLFAAFLYEPSPSLAVSDPASRNHLIWMLIIGLLISDLLARFRHAKP